MASAKIFRINYKSDFILTLTSDAGWMTPFCIKFWTGAPSQAYYVGWDGETYNHCSFDPSEPTKLQVQFDDHHLPIGDLKYQVAYHFTVADFPNDTEDEVINPASITTEIDGETYHVMLDFTGETAPEIEFSLPAYANEAQRIANEQARIAAEQQRIANEDARIQAEETRQQNEQQRIAQETARVNEFATLKSQSQAATRDANDAATLANQKAQLAQDKADLAQAAATLANQKAQLAADKAALANDAAQLANEKAALAQQKAEYAQQQGGYAKDQGDYAKNQGDYAKEQGDTALADHQRAEADHGIAADDHTQAGNDHTRAESDHGIAVDDHTQAGNDHTRAESDHGIAADDHTQAGNDHTRAESDHTRAESDHAAVEVYVDSLGVFDLSKHNAVGGVLATYADLSAALTALNALESKYKYGGMSFKFVCTSDNKYVQARCMAQNFTTDTTQWQVVDDVPTPGSDNLVKSGGVRNFIVNSVNSEKERAELAEQVLQDNIDNIKDETLEENRQMVNSIMENYAPVEITGDVNNAADEEDLTSVSVEGTDVLKFKDKVYNPLVYSGLGRKILRKNIVNNVNTLTQSMISDANTIYVIQYNFTLGEDITIPANCVLEFDGGSLSNGSISLNNTIIDSENTCFKDSLLLTSAANIPKIYTKWFGIKTINELLNLIIKQSSALLFIVDAGSYTSSQMSPVTINRSVSVIGDGNVDFLMDSSIQVLQTNGNLKFENINFRYTTPNTEPFVVSTGTKTKFLDCLWYNGGTIAQMGVGSTAGFNLHIKNMKGITIANIGNPFIKLIKGAGCYFNTFNEIHHIESAVPLSGQPMNTREGTDVILVEGTWDTIDLCIFAEKMYNIITIRGNEDNVTPTTALNINVHNCIFDYVRNSVIYAYRLSIITGLTLFNNYIYTYEGNSINIPMRWGNSTVEEDGDGTNNKAIIRNTLIQGNNFVRSGRYHIILQTRTGLHASIEIKDNKFQSAFQYSEPSSSDKMKEVLITTIRGVSYSNNSNTSVDNVGSIQEGSILITNAQQPVNISGNVAASLRVGYSGSDTHRRYFPNNLISDMPLAGAFDEKPTGLTSKDKGYNYYDETNDIPIYWNGTAWVDATGTVV